MTEFLERKAAEILVDAHKIPIEEVLSLISRHKDLVNMVYYSAVNGMKSDHRLAALLLAMRQKEISCGRAECDHAAGVEQHESDRSRHFDVARSY